MKFSIPRLATACIVLAAVTAVGLSIKDRQTSPIPLLPQSAETSPTYSPSTSPQSAPPSESPSGEQAAQAKAGIVTAGGGTQGQPTLASAVNSPKPEASPTAAGQQPSSSAEDKPRGQAAVTPTPRPALKPSDIRYTDKVVMLMYHHISPNEEGVTITQERFAQQMQALEDASYRVISMEEYIGFMKENKPVPPNAVVITFDDGYESYYRFAYPEMKKHGFTGTNFVIVSYVDMPNPSLPYLTWDQIQEMKKDGFSFYSHTYNLHIKKSNGGKEPVPALTNRLWLDKENRLETEEEYRKRVKEDLLLAEQTLKEKLGNEQSILCFPFGAYNKTVLEIAREAGIQYYSTINDGINTQNGREFVRVHAGVPNMSADKLLAKLAKFSDTGKSR